MATAALIISSRHYATKEMLVTTTCKLLGPSSSSHSSNILRKMVGSMSGGFGTCCPSHRSYSSLMHDHHNQQYSSRNCSSIMIRTNNYSTSNNNEGKGSLSSIKSDTESILYKFSHEPQTAISLQTLMRTGRGEFLHKHWKDEDTPSNNNDPNQHSSTSTDSDVDDDDGSKVATERVLIQVAGFLRRELPIRLAHRVNDLESMPIFSDMPSAMTVRDLYINSFMDLISVPKHISNKQEEEAFARLVEGIYERHASVLVIMARAAYEFRDAQRKKKGMDGATTTATNNNNGNGNGGAVEYEDMEDLHAFLDRFYVSRIGIRVLIGQYLALRQPYMENYVGIICSKTSPFEIVLQAIDDASFMCARKYGDAPEVIITGRKDLTFPYVPTHLHYIMLELIKNSMRATVDWHGVDSDYPPIKVVIADGKDNEDVVIKVSDEGGGIPRSNMKRIWSYLFTTADPEVQEGIVEFNSDNVDHSIDSPLAGLGYGLPISRSYARYFGGDLSIMSMEGYGTDAFVYLTRLGTSREPLPI